MLDLTHALRIAAHNDHVGVVTSLLRAKACVCVMDLAYAALHVHGADVCAALVNHRDTDLCGSLCMATVLKLAVRASNMTLVAPLLVAKAFPNCDLVAPECLPDSVPLFLAKVDPNELHAYVRKVHPGTVLFHVHCPHIASLLLEYKANVNGRNTYPCFSGTPLVTPLHRSACRTRLELRLYIDGKQPRPSIREQEETKRAKEAEETDARLVKVLLDAKAHTDAMDSFGQTALHLSVRYDSSLEICKLLLTAMVHAGIPCDLRTKYGQTALDIARDPARKGRDGVVELLQLHIH